MKDYLTFCNPTKIYFTSYKELGSIIDSYGFKRVVLFIGGSSLKESGVLDEVLNDLNNKSIQYHLISGIKPNPDVSSVIEAINKTKRFDPQLVVAIGGGSVIDAAKSYANSFYYDGNPIDFNKKIAVPSKVLSVATVVTIAASGSEMSSSCVMSDRAENFKGGFNSPTNYPLFSILDSSLLKSVSDFQLACGAIDIISHSFERYFCKSKEYEISDLFALSVIKNIVRISDRLFDKNRNDDVLTEMLYTSTLSHNGITSFGKISKMTCHFAEHKLSGLHPEVAHGLGLSWLMVEFLKRNEDLLKEKIREFGKMVFDSYDNVIEKFDSYIKFLPLDSNYKSYGISDEEMEDYYSLLKLS